MDLFGNIPFVDENSPIATGLPKQKLRKDVFTFVESELKALETDMVAAKANEYGRADQAAAWALLAKLYLNSKVYTGTDRYTDAITYCNKLIGASYTLHPNYKELTIADNNLNTDENIFTITNGINLCKTTANTTRNTTRLNAFVIFILRHNS